MTRKFYKNKIVVRGQGNKYKEINNSEIIKWNQVGILWQ